MATEDLLSFNKMDSEKHKRISSKGGVNSGKSKRRKKALKELLEIALSEPVDESSDGYMAITVALIQKAVEGDVRAYGTIRDTLGQMPTAKVDFSGDTNINISIEDENDV